MQETTTSTVRLRHGKRFWFSLLGTRVLSSWREFWLYPLSSLATLFVIGISLSVPVSLYTFLSNLTQTQDAWQQSHRITMFLDKNIAAQNITDLKNTLSQHPEVNSFTFTSASDTRAQFQALSGVGAALDYLDTNPFPALFDVIPAETAQTAAKMQQLAAEFEKISGVEQVKLDAILLEKLRALVALVKQATFMFASLLITAVVLIMTYALRQSVLQRQEEIAVLKLIGATDGFIVRPFLMQAAWFGVLGASVAWWLSTSVVFWCQEQAMLLAEIYQTPFQLQALGFYQGILLILFTLSLCLSTAFIAVRRQIRAIKAC